MEKRIDNLTRPGHHTCGKCYLATTPIESDLEERVRRLEEFIARLSPQVEGELRKVRPGTNPSLEASRFSNVSYDDDGELWEARSLSGRTFFWRANEEEAAYAARVYLELTHATLNRRLIADAELSLPDERQGEIRFEVIEAL